MPATFPAATGSALAPAPWATTSPYVAASTASQAAPAHDGMLRPIISRLAAANVAGQKNDVVSNGSGTQAPIIRSTATLTAPSTQHCSGPTRDLDQIPVARQTDQPTATHQAATSSPGRR